MKKVFIAVVLLFALALGGFGGYRYWKTTPSYAISQIRASVQNHDPVLFRQYVNLERVLDSGVESALAAKGEQNWAKEIARGMAISLKPRLVSELRKRIESWIETGQVPAGGSGPVSAAANAVINQITQLLFLKVTDVRRAQKNFLVNVKLRHQLYGCELEPELLMQQSPTGQLRLVEINNLGDLLTQLWVGEMAWKESQNAAARKKIEAVLQVTGVTKSTRDELLGILRKIVVSANARNASDQAITRIEVLLTATTLVAPQKTKKWPVVFEQIIPAGKTEPLSWEMPVNPFHADEMANYKADADGLSLTFEVNSVTLEGGKRIEIPYPE